jgi:hypothetical protein
MPPVMRSHAFGRLMVRLALAAMLLMALAPTISRTLASGADPNGPVLRLLQMCTTAGLQVQSLASFLGDDVAGFAGDEHPAPHPHEPGDACGYCSLVTPLPLLLLLLCGLLALPPVAPLFRHRIVARRTLRNLRGLGAQGPPLPL